jgi:hypothetical protein
MASDFQTAAADAGPLRAELRELEGLADGFGRAMTTAFRRSVVDGRALEDVLRSLALSLSSRALNQALAPIGQGIGSLLSGALGDLSRGARFGGGAFAGPAPFANGGASAPEPFLAGARSDGAQRGVNVVFNVTTPDAQSFRRAEVEVSAMLARAVARGQRGL